MQKALALLTAHLGVGIAQDEANCRKEITLAGAIATDNDISLGREGLNDGLVLVAGWQVRGGGVGGCGRLGGTNLLKPWMMICLIYMMNCAGSEAQFGGLQ